MAVTTTTHLNFRGSARQALEFYRDVFGGDLVTATYADVGAPKEAPGADKIVFGQVSTADGLCLMAYDVPGMEEGASAIAGVTRREHGATITDRTFFQSLRADDLAEARRYFEALGAGAEIVEPLAASAWSPGFGMLTDRFGVTWIIDVQPTQAD